MSTGSDSFVCQSTATVSGLIRMICLMSCFFATGRDLGADSGKTVEPESGDIPGVFESAVAGCLMQMDSGLDFQLGLPRRFIEEWEAAAEKKKRTKRRVLRSILWTAERKKEGRRAMEDRTPDLIDRFQYEFLLNLVQTVKHFYQTVDTERDRTYGTIGQFTAAYRRVLFPVPRSIWEERLSASAFVYKLGTNTPNFSHIRTGGWAFLEYNMHSHEDPTHRFLVMLAPVGILKDNVNYKRARSTAVRWLVEAAGGVEGLWDLGRVAPTVRALVAPRYGKNWAYRLHSELALQIRITSLDSFTARWFSEVVLVPKLVYLYSSDSLADNSIVGEMRWEWPLPGWLGWLDFRKDLTAYLQVEFRLRN